MGKLLPSLYDIAMNPLERGSFQQIRSELLQQAKGNVLEIGSGTGINFPIYKNVTQVDAIEPNRKVQETAKKRIEQASVPIYLHQQSAEEIQFEDNRFDSIVATLVFCSIPNATQALRELQRVGKKGAKILFFEHVKMKQPFLSGMQEVLNPLWKTVCNGCHLNRDTLQLVKEHNFRVDNVRSYYKGLFLVMECTNNKV